VGAIVRATTLSGKVSGATCSDCVPVSRDPLADYSGISTSWITEKREALQPGEGGDVPAIGLEDPLEPRERG
jgi:hypothetical protein